MAVIGEPKRRVEVVPEPHHVPRETDPKEASPEKTEREKNVPVPAGE